MTNAPRAAEPSPELGPGSGSGSGSEAGPGSGPGTLAEAGPEAGPGTEEAESEAGAEGIGGGAGPEAGARLRRADARRNRARVLRAAQDALATGGVDVPLDEIARLAGVGPGTVYRHFSSKESLIEAVLVERVAQLATRTRELGAADDPGAAFYAFFAETVERVAFNKVLAAAVAGRRQVLTRTAAGLKGEFHEAVAALLERAQRVGAVRRDVDCADVVALISGCVTMEDHGRPPGRMVAITCDALRPTGVSPVSPAVTEQPPSGVNRNETADAPGGDGGHETPDGHCTVCGARLPARDTGRPRRYCGDACRQKAHRQRASRQGDRGSASAAPTEERPGPRAAGIPASAGVATDRNRQG